MQPPVTGCRRIVSRRFLPNNLAGLEKGNGQVVDQPEFLQAGGGHFYSKRVGDSVARSDSAFRIKVPVSVDGVQGLLKGRPYHGDRRPAGLSHRVLIMQQICIDSYAVDRGIARVDIPIASYIARRGFVLRVYGGLEGNSACSGASVYIPVLIEPTS